MLIHQRSSWFVRNNSVSSILSPHRRWMVETSEDDLHGHLSKCLSKSLTSKHFRHPCCCAASRLMNGPGNRDPRHPPPPHAAPYDRASVPTTVSLMGIRHITKLGPTLQHSDLLMNHRFASTSSHIPRAPAFGVTSGGDSHHRWPRRLNPKGQTRTGCC